MKSTRSYLREAAKTLGVAVLVLGLAPSASADDANLLTVSNVPPPNILFAFDTSGSMNNMLCQDFTSTALCSTAGLTQKVTPNGAKICTSPALNAVVNTPPGGGSATVYQA